MPRGSGIADVADTLRWGRGAQHSVWDLRDPGPTWHLATWRLRNGAAAQRRVSATSAARPPRRSTEARRRSPASQA